MIFSGTQQQQDIHFNIAETPSNKAESGVSSSLSASVIRHTRDEPRHISSPPVNANTTPELGVYSGTPGWVRFRTLTTEPNPTGGTRIDPLITEAEDYAQANSSSNVYDDGHAVASPSHFICYACDKCFIFKSQLDRHYVIHSGERSFSCQICEQKFSVKCNLRRHMLTHSEQKARECDGCHKVCTRKANLVRHYRIHTGEKTYTCEKSGKSFSDPSHFNKQRKSSGSSSKMRNCCFLGESCALPQKNATNLFYF
ncbi:Zinc finger protein 468 [Araneus ventricosus]|uniref:Zinc finger protein 468 n=2 Tax=Araneus ventricosus TaxID=182803 RepID=A0A4Y2NPH9_ARAVE|nr:Zinc finger protein 468 [Araneus ventricosus]